MVEKLARIYSLDHEIIIYEAVTNPLEKVRIDRIALKDLPNTPLKSISTLMIPAAVQFEKDTEFLRKLEAIAQSGDYSIVE
jgi:hypothetical protein